MLNVVLKEWPKSFDAPEHFKYTLFLLGPLSSLKCHYDENRIFSIEATLKHKQLACMRRKMLFIIFIPEIFKLLKYAN